MGIAQAQEKTTKALPENSQKLKRVGNISPWRKDERVESR